MGVGTEGEEEGKGVLDGHCQALIWMSTGWRQVEDVEGEGEGEELLLGLNTAAQALICISRGGREAEEVEGKGEEGELR